MLWFDWILRLFVTTPGPRTVRWPRLTVQSLEERAVPHGTGVDHHEPPKVVVVDEQATLNPYQQIGDRVWIDKNGNGFQDLGEPGAGFVKMQLFEGDKLVGSTMSDPNGRYAFNRWNVHNGTTDSSDDGLKEHTTYQIRVANDQLALTALRPTLANQGAGFDDEQRDSDATAITDGVAIDLTTGDDDIYIHFDVGYAPAYSVGNLVWHDANNNGKRDLTEAGIGGVTLNLLDATSLQLLATTTTADDGSYSFRGLVAGSYVVEVAAGNFQTGGVLAGFASSTGKPGQTGVGPFEGIATPNAEVSHIDGDDNGSSIANAVRSSPIPLGTRGAVDNTIDFGFFRSTSLSGKVFVDVNGNGQKDAEDIAGLANVRIRIAGPIGMVTATTDANGNYSFGSLPAGTYSISRLDQPAGYRATSPSWATRSLAASTSTTLDFGQTASVNLRLRQSANLMAVNSGGSIVLTYRVSNLGARDATGVVLSLPLPGGFRYVRTLTSGAAYDTATNSVSLGTIAAGTETIVRIRVQSVRAGAFWFRATVSGLEPEENVRNNRSVVMLTSVPTVKSVIRSVVSALMFR